MKNKLPPKSKGLIRYEKIQKKRLREWKKAMMTIQIFKCRDYAYVNAEHCRLEHKWLGINYDKSQYPK